MPPRPALHARRRSRVRIFTRSFRGDRERRGSRARSRRRPVSSAGTASPATVSSGRTWTVDRRRSTVVCATATPGTVLARALHMRATSTGRIHVGRSAVGRAERYVGAVPAERARAGRTGSRRQVRRWRPGRATAASAGVRSTRRCSAARAHRRSRHARSAVLVRRRAASARSPIAVTTAAGTAAARRSAAAAGSRCRQARASGTRAVGLVGGRASVPATRTSRRCSGRPSGPRSACRPPGGPGGVSSATSQGHWTPRYRFSATDLVAGETRHVGIASGEAGQPAALSDDAGYPERRGGRDLLVGPVLDDEASAWCRDRLPGSQPRPRDRSRAPRRGGRHGARRSPCPRHRAAPRTRIR